jgi:hypothetical protein
MARRRTINLFSMSLLDCICCGFGAVILLYVIINARAAASRDRQVLDLRGEVSRLDFEVLKGRKNLVQVRNALDEMIDELVRTEGRSRELIAAVEADRQGDKLREFKGTGDRHYLTGLKVGGRRILVLVDCSASMLAETVVEVVRLRNMPDEDRRRAAKWQQAVRTVDWLSTQLPRESKFQVYGFNETAFALVPESEGAWLDAGSPDDLARAVDGFASRIPEKGTSLYHAFAVIDRMPSPPDNVILLTDGLPTRGEGRSRDYRVSAGRRASLFRSAIGGLPAGLPVNVILYPMEGDPEAASAFWRLAVDSNGSFFCPAEDWP